jgi:hypothetical protein
MLKILRLSQYDGSDFSYQIWDISTKESLKEVACGIAEFLMSGGVSEQEKDNLDEDELEDELEDVYTWPELEKPYQKQDWDKIIHIITHQKLPFKIGLEHNESLFTVEEIKKGWGWELNCLYQ